MQQHSLKTHDLIAIALGMIGWVFPNISVGVKILISAIIIAIIIYVMMNRQQKEKTLNAVGNFFEGYVIPSFTGAIYTFFAAYIIFILLTVFFGVHLLEPPSNLPQDSPTWNFNFSGTGKTIIIIAVIVGAVVNVSDKGSQKRKIAQRQEEKK